MGDVEVWVGLRNILDSSYMVFDASEIFVIKLYLLTFN